MAGSIDDVFVIDASVVLTTLMPDEGKKGEAKRFLDLIGKLGNLLLAPVVLDFEVGNGLRTAVLRGRLDKKGIWEIYGVYKDYGVILLELDGREVLRLAVDEKLSFYDAAYVVLARSRKAKLLTLDKKLARVYNKLC